MNEDEYIGQCTHCGQNLKRSQARHLKSWVVGSGITLKSGAKSGRFRVHTWECRLCGGRFKTYTKPDIKYFGG